MSDFESVLPVPEGYYFFEIPECPFFISPLRPYLEKPTRGIELLVRRDRFIDGAVFSFSYCFQGYRFNVSPHFPMWDLREPLLLRSHLEHWVTLGFCERPSPGTYEALRSVYPIPQLMALIDSRFFRESSGGLFYREGISPDAPHSFPDA